MTSAIHVDQVSYLPCIARDMRLGDLVWAKLFSATFHLPGDPALVIGRPD